ncbi:acid protease [Polyporus arcularius HHB13444]|uniref:Acid protease n=1 Tax=Polyporus arcularius HHB13444 TaxID=1314778 RepID=A0A5C3PH59_9APHY|nr:acid protease [Polyporus arcularius HHB13444]
MACLTAALLLLVVTSAYRVTGVQVSIEGVRRVNGTWAGHHSSIGTGTMDILSGTDLEWFTEVTLGGRQYRVLVDSGSADLWVAGTVPVSNDTGTTGSVRYTDGTRVAGQIRTASLEVGGLSVQNQAYIQQEVDSDHPSGLGILGIGPATLSSIKGVLDEPAGAPPLANLLGHDEPAQYMTILLNRTEDISNGVPGLLTIGEMQPGLEHVKNMPELVVNNSAPGGHWMVSLDSGGILGPDGEVVKATQGTPLKIIFDAGYTLSRVPTPITDAIYSRVPGARVTSVVDIVDPVWILPCHFELNVTFKLGGISYPIHPLDTVISDILGPQDNAGKPTCVGAFQPSPSSEQPMILGTMFLRNVYLLMTFGDVVDDSVTMVDGPFMQILPITQPSQAHIDFVQERLNGVDTTGSTTFLPLPNDNSDVTSRPLKHSLPWIIVASVVGALVVAFSAAAVFIHFRGRRYKALRGGEASLDTSDDIVFIGPHGSLPAEAPVRTPASDPDPMARTKYSQAMKRLSQAGSPIRGRNFLSVLSRLSMVREERLSLLSDAAPPAVCPSPDARSSTPPSPHMDSATLEKHPTPLPPSSMWLIPETLPRLPAPITPPKLFESSLPLAPSDRSSRRPLPVPPVGPSYLPKPSLRIATSTDRSNDRLELAERRLPNPYDRHADGIIYQTTAETTVDYQGDSQEPTARGEARVLRIPRRASAIRPLPDPRA